jgi:hypothetical protein
MTVTENQISPQKNSEADLAENIGFTDETSWTPPENMCYEEWQRIGNTLQQLDRSIAFWTGDWLNAGESKYGEKYAQAITVTGNALETLKKRAAVAKRIPAEIRIATLTFTHHFYAAYIPESEREPLLQMADFFGMTSRQFREAVSLPDDERAHLVDLWVNFDGPDHPQTLMALRTLEQFGTIYLPEEEDEDNTDGPDQDGEVVEHQVILDGDEYKYETSAGDQIYDFWKKTGVPLVFTDQKQAEWNGIRVVAILNEDGNPMLLWDMVSVS